MVSLGRMLVVVLSIWGMAGCKSPEGGGSGPTEGTGSSGATGTDTTPDTPTGTGAPAFDPQAAAAQICSTIVACECQSPPFADEAACVTEMLAAFSAAEAFAADNGLVFDDGCISKLAAAYPGFGCEFPSHELRCTLCAPVHGDRPIGAECMDQEFGSDCAQGLGCGYQGKCVGRCGATGEGQSCTYDDECADGLACSDDYVCTVLPAVGESCQNVDCPAGLLCTGGVCVVPVGEGESCLDVCCAEGLFCMDDVCVPRLGEGEDCEMIGISTCESRCMEGLHCDPSAVCAQPQQLGEPCDFFDLPCADGGECTDDVCVPDVYYCEESANLPWLNL